MYEVIDDNPYSGINYYRLKQVDYNNSYKDSKIISVKTYLLENDLNVYPNPVTGEEFSVAMSGLESNESVLVVLTDVVGNILYSKVKLSDENGAYAEQISSEPLLKSGVYVVVGSTKNAIYKKKILVK